MAESTPAGWYVDPSGRHDHRYWDGVSWGDEVADAGRTGIDPMRRPTPPRVAIGVQPTAAATATRSQRQQAQRRGRRPRRKKWPWVGGIVGGLMVLAGGGAVLLGVGASKAGNQLNAEQLAHAISTAQFEGVQLGTSQPKVVAGLGKQPEDPQRFVSKGILTTQDLTSPCIYYNRNGGKFGNRFQFCFTNGALTTKKSF